MSSKGRKERERDRDRDRRNRDSRGERDYRRLDPSRIREERKLVRSRSRDIHRIQQKREKERLRSSDHRGDRGRERDYRRLDPSRRREERRLVRSRSRDIYRIQQKREKERLRSSDHRGNRGRERGKDRDYRRLDRSRRREGRRLGRSQSRDIYRTQQRSSDYRGDRGRNRSRDQRRDKTRDDIRERFRRRRSSSRSRDWRGRNRDGRSRQDWREGGRQGRDQGWSRERHRGFNRDERKEGRSHRGETLELVESPSHSLDFVKSPSKSPELVENPSKSRETKVVVSVDDELYKAFKRNNQFVWACRYEDVDRVRQLLAEGADVNSQDWIGFTGLKNCIENNNLELLELLLSHTGFTVECLVDCLVFATAKNREEIVRRLCLVDGIDIDLNVSTMKRLHYHYEMGTALQTSLFWNNLSFVKLFISHGAKVRQEDIQECKRSVEALEALLEVCQPSIEPRLDVSEESEEEQEEENVASRRDLVTTLMKATSRPLSLKQQCRNSVRDVLRLRSKGGSVWPSVEALEQEFALPDSLVDYLLVFPARGWREERARKVAESLNNIAGVFCEPSDNNKTASLHIKVPERILVAAGLAGQTAEVFYSSQVKDQTGLTISPSFIDHHLHHQPGTFSYEIKITVEREMMEKIRKLKMFHKSVKDSSWSLVVRRIKWGELKTLHLVFDDTDWRLVVRSVRLGQERKVIRAKLATILSRLEFSNPTSTNFAKQELAKLMSQLTRAEDPSDNRV